MPGWSWEPNRFLLMTAHQMGTCRMGGDAGRHPLTPEGRLREVPNLFVADASAFPTCSGANPMASVQHIAHYVAQHIKAEA
jgi:choline dehydrogenase-like flavoprotein